MNNIGETMVGNGAQRTAGGRIRRGAMLAIGAALLPLAAPAPAQTGAPAADTPEAAAQNGPSASEQAVAAQLGLPDDLTVFGRADPNVRRATAVVNGEIITATDVDQRLALLIAANGGKVPEEERNRLKLQVLRNLIDETLQIQAAKADGIAVSQPEIDESFARVASNFRRSPQDFTEYLRSQGSSATSMKRQIEGELAWNRLLRRNIQPFVNVGEEEVNSVIERLNAAKGTDEYRIGEIYLSATSETAPQVTQNMGNIIRQIQAGGSFASYARSYSEASTAAVGGDLGWVRPAQLPDALARAAANLQVGQIAGPVEVPGGFSILYLIDKRKVLTTDPRDSVLSLKQLSISFPPGITPAQAKARADQFAEQVKTIKGCGSANAAARAIGADVVDNDGIAVRDLPGALQEVMLQMQVGEASPPFGSVKDGVRVLILCGRDDPKAAGAPSFDQIMSQLEDDRVNKRARIYLRDLRRDAVIDYN